MSTPNYISLLHVGRRAPESEQLEFNWEPLDINNLKFPQGNIVCVFGGNNTKKASHLYLNTFADLLKKVAELQSLISNCPSVEELQKLRETNKRFEEINNKLEIVMAEKLRLESENNDLRVSKDEIESLRKFIKILE